MAKFEYVSKRFTAATLEIIEHANEIIEKYEAAGYTLTLRQLYYRFVAANLLRNRQENYDKLGAIISDARLAGMIDWDAIEDRSRFVRSNSHWNAPGDIIKSASQSYAIDKWADQKHYIEVWVEKDALVEIVGQVAQRLDVPYFSCRGYTSQTMMRSAALRLCRAQQLKKQPVIIHLGDHDPSGKDMTRDIDERLAMFCRSHGFRAPDVDRIALNFDQIEEYDPPANPAKTSDSRFESYVVQFGHDSWELDALEPEVLDKLITHAIEKRMDKKLFQAASHLESQQREMLLVASKHWSDITDFMDRKHFKDFMKAEDYE